MCRVIVKVGGIAEEWPCSAEEAERIASARRDEWTKELDGMFDPKVEVTIEGHQLGQRNNTNHGE